MIGGSMKMTSRFAIVAAAGVLLGAAVTSAKAADLGGGCCADLEERVAELEATTARKGNRVVSLQVYGQVNKALLIWDDGIDSDAFIVDNDYSGSRVGFTGSAALKPGWKAGFLVELDIQDAASNQVDNDTRFRRPAPTKFPFATATSISRARSGAGLRSDRARTAADGVTEVVLGNSLRNSDLHHGNDFLIRDSPMAAPAGLRLDQWASNLDGGRDDVIRYDSPSIYGFIVSASWGDDDYADIALRFKKEWNSVRVAAAIAYQWDSSGDAISDLSTLPTSVMARYCRDLSRSCIFRRASMGLARLDVSKLTRAAIPRPTTGMLSWVLRRNSCLMARRLSMPSMVSIMTWLHVFDGDFDSDIGESEVQRWGSRCCPEVRQRSA